MTDFASARGQVEDVLGSAVVAHVPVVEGGYSRASRWVVKTADGASAFVKAEVPISADFGLALEHLVYSSVRAACLPTTYGFRRAEGEADVLVTEDLSSARWGTPVTSRDAALLAEAIEEATSAVGPPGVPLLDYGKRWPALAAEPQPLLATGLVDGHWLAQHVDTLIEAERPLVIDGDRLLHTDLFLQNWCRAPRGAVIVDWAGARLGNPEVMRALAEGGVRAAGGAAGVVVDRSEYGWAAWAAGQTAGWLADDGTDIAPRLLETQRREALACLRWACAALDLEPPTLGPVFARLGPWRP